MPNNDLGFGKPLDLGGFEPKRDQGTAIPTSTQREDEIAARHGFVSREPSVRLKRPVQDEPQDNVYIRAPLSVINQFKTYCAENRLSYGQALAAFLVGDGASR